MNRTKARKKVIKRLKNKARKHYYASVRHDDLDCGDMMADLVQGTDMEGQAREYARCVARLRRIDPDFPKGNDYGPD